jgi:hypothetical protein
MGWTNLLHSSGRSVQRDPDPEIDPSDRRAMSRDESIGRDAISDRL